MWISPYHIKWVICLLLSETVTSVSSVKLGINTRHDFRVLDTGPKALHKGCTPQIKLQHIYDTTRLATSIDIIVNNATETVLQSIDKTTTTLRSSDRVTNIVDSLETPNQKLKEPSRDDEILGKTKNVSVKYGRKFHGLHPSLGKRKQPASSVGKQSGRMKKDAEDLTRVKNPMNCASDNELNGKSLNTTESEIITDNTFSSPNNEIVNPKTTVTMKDNDTPSVDKNTEKNTKDTHKDGENIRLLKVSWLQGLPMKTESNVDNNNKGDFRQRSANDTKLLNSTTGISNDVINYANTPSNENQNAIEYNNETSIKGLNRTASNNVENTKNIIDDTIRNNLNETKDERTSFTSSFNDSNSPETVSTKVNDIDTGNLMTTENENDLQHDFDDIKIITNNIDIDSGDNHTSKIKIKTKFESTDCSAELPTNNGENTSTEKGTDIIEATKKITICDEQIGYTDTNISTNTEGSKTVKNEEVSVPPKKTTTVDTVGADINNNTSQIQAEAKTADNETSRTDTFADATEAQEISKRYFSINSSQAHLTTLLENVKKNPEIFVSTKVELKTPETRTVGPKRENKEIETSLSYIDSDLHHKTPQSSSNLYKYNKPYSKTLMGYLYRRLLGSTTLVTTEKTTTRRPNTEKSISQTPKPKRPTVILNFAYKKPVLGYLKNIQTVMSVNNEHNKAPKGRNMELVGTEKPKNERKPLWSNYSGGSSLKKVRKDGKEDRRFAKFNRLMTNFEATLKNQTTSNSTSDKKEDAGSDLWKQMQDKIMEINHGIENGTQSISNDEKKAMPKIDKDQEQTFFDLFNIDYLDGESSQAHQQNGSKPNPETTPMDEILRAIMAMDRPFGESNYQDIAQQPAYNKNNLLTKKNNINSQGIIGHETTSVGNETENNVINENQNPEETAKIELGHESNNLIGSTVDKETTGNNESGTSQFADEYAKQLAAYPKYPFLFGSASRTTKVIDNRKTFETNRKESEINAQNAMRTDFTNRTWNVNAKSEVRPKITDLGYERAQQQALKPNRYQAKDLVQRLMNRYKPRVMVQRKGRLLFDNAIAKTHPPVTEKEQLAHVLPSLLNSRGHEMENDLDNNPVDAYDVPQFGSVETTPLVALLYKPRGKKIEDGNCTSESEMENEGGEKTSGRVTGTTAGPKDKEEDGSFYKSVGENLYAALGEMMKAPAHVLRLTEKLVQLF